MPVRLAVLLLLACIAGCSKPDLPDTVVRAPTVADLTAFRSDLGTRFPAERLTDFDTALQELKLAAMNQGVDTAAARDEHARAAADGQTVRAVLILGWQARRTRLRAEQELMAGYLAADLKREQETAATGTPLSVRTHLENERAILARLETSLAETDRSLAAWGVPAGAK